MLVVVCFALGLLAKPMLVTLPFVLLLLDYWPLGRVTLVGAAEPDRGVTRSSHRERSCLACCAKSCRSSRLPSRRASSLSSSSSEAAPLFPSIGHRSSSAPRMRWCWYATYIGKMLWPSGLAAFYPLTDSIPAWQVIGAALILIAGFAVALRTVRRHPYLLVGWLWYVGTLVPVIGLVQVGNQRMADRYTYIPLIGLFLIVAWGVPDLLGRWRYRRIALTVAAGLVVAACAVTARAQVRAWENSLTVWQLPGSLSQAKDLTVAINRVVAENRLKEGDALSRAGRIDEAILRLLRGAAAQTSFRRSAQQPWGRADAPGKAERGHRAIRGGSAFETGLRRRTSQPRPGTGPAGTTRRGNC